MGWEAWFLVAVVLGTLALLVRESLPADVILAGALTLIVVVHELTGSERLPSISEVVAGMGNTGLITVGVLFVVAGLMIAFECCSLTQARQSIDWSLLVVIAAALGLGRAIDSTGLADHVAQTLELRKGQVTRVGLVGVVIADEFAADAPILGGVLAEHLDRSVNGWIELLPEAVVGPEGRDA